jgi:hypothetical protein
MSKLSYSQTPVLQIAADPFFYSVKYFGCRRMTIVGNEKGLKRPFVFLLMIRPGQLLFLKFNCLAQVRSNCQISPCPGAPP